MIEYMELVREHRLLKSKFKELQNDLLASYNARLELQAQNTAQTETIHQLENNLALLNRLAERELTERERQINQQTRGLNRLRSQRDNSRHSNQQLEEEVNHLEQENVALQRGQSQLE